VPRTEEATAKEITPELADKATMVVVPDIVTRRIYVKAGKRDTLASVAKRNRVTIEQIKTWNNLRSDKLANGQRLELHVPQRVVAKKGGKTVVARKAPARRVAAPVKKVAPKKAVATSKTTKKRT
jgi:membrane-bound lytic murein transglycosylase D